MGGWIARLGVVALLLSPLAAQQAEADAAAARKVFDVLKAGDAAALTALVDFDRRSAERVARYQQSQQWSEMAEEERASTKENLILDWVEWAPDFNRRAQIFAVQAVDDPDKGLGAVPDRRIVRLIARNVYSSQLNDIVLTLTTDGRLLDLDQGPPYPTGANPDGPEGRMPRAYFNAAPPEEATWPALPDDQPDHRDATVMVDELMGKVPGVSITDARLKLHKYPRPAVARMVERLAEIDAQPQPDAAAEALLGVVLQQITGHGQVWLPMQPPDMDEATWRAKNHANVRDWCAWHAAQGWIFEAQPLPTNAQLAAAPVPTAPAGNKPPKQPPGAKAPGAPPPRPPGASAPASAPPAAPVANAARGTKRELLFPAAADLHLRYQGRAVTGREVEPQLAPALKEALNQWAEIATQLKLTVVSTGSPDILVIGSAPDETLDLAAKWMTEALELLAPIVPVVEGHEPKTIVAVFFDRVMSKTPAWGTLLDDLVARRVLLETTAAEMRSAPAGLLRRQAPMFLQPTFDLGEDSADGGGEFQLGNEVVGKLTQCLVTQRCGELPRTILWGLDYVVEMQMFTAVYQFDSEGFMATADHFDWPVRTKQMLAKAMKSRDFSLATLAGRDADAGKPVDSQMVTWAALEWMRREQPEALGKLLKDLAALQAATGPRYATSWTPAPEPTVKAAGPTLGAVDAKDVQAWLDAL